MWPLYGSLVAGDAITVALVTHRLPVSPLAMLCSDTQFLSPPCAIPPLLGKVRSEERWSLPSWTPPPPSQRPAHKMAASFPQQKIEMSIRIEIRENPSIRYPSRYPTVTFWCAAALSLLISLQSSSVCSVITQPPVYVKKKRPHPPSCAHRHAF